MSFQKAYITGLLGMLQQKADLDRLKFMPQCVKANQLINFNGSSLGAVQSEDVIIFDLDRVNNATRYTSALSKEYLAALTNHMYLFEEGFDSAVIDESHLLTPEKSLEDQLLAIVEEGDRKGARKLLKELKEKWFALDPEAVDDALLDLADCVSDKDVTEAKAIIAELVGEDEPVPTEAPVEENAPAKGVVSAEALEIIEDLESAVADKDEGDIKELLEELKAVDAELHKQWSAKLSTPTKTEEVPKEKELTVADEIILDLEDAFKEGDLKEGDLKEAEELLGELKAEVGEDAATYKEWATKLTPEPKKRERKRRS